MIFEHWLIIIIEGASQWLGNVNFRQKIRKYLLWFCWSFEIVSNTINHNELLVNWIGNLEMCWNDVQLLQIEKWFRSDQISEEALHLNCCDFVRTCCHCENIYNFEVEVEESESTNQKHTHTQRRSSRLCHFKWMTMQIKHAESERAT